jgi:hypothetical protein
VGDQLIVVGFHHSGASLVCRLLERAGLFLGYELFGFELNPALPWARVGGGGEVGGVTDPTVTARTSTRRPISGRKLIDRIEATRQTLEQLGKQSERTRKK